MNSEYDSYTQQEALTPTGRKWAEEHAWTSMVASVALSGASTRWPATHFSAAVKACNETSKTA